MPIVPPPRRPASWNMGPWRAPFTVCAFTITIDGVGCRSCWRRSAIARRVIARAQTPLARQRRHCAQTAVQEP